MIPQILQSISQIKDLMGRADANGQTQKLICEFAELQKIRTPFFLTLSEFDMILKWKLRSQYKRQITLRERNTDKNIKIITRAVFEIEHENDEIATELKIKMLCSLSGVEVPVASAILTICNPKLYSVIDFRNWRQVYPGITSKNNYSVKEYVSYLKIIRELADNYELTPQEIDMAIWQLDIEQQNVGAKSK